MVSSLSNAILLVILVSVNTLVYSFQGYGSREYNRRSNSFSKQKTTFETELLALPEYLDLPSKPLSSTVVNSPVENSFGVESLFEKFTSFFSTNIADKLSLGSDGSFNQIFINFLSLVNTNIAIETILVFVAGSIIYKLSFPEEGYRRGYEPYPRGSYDPLVAKAYYSRHPLLVVRRSLQLLRFSNGFIFNILFDKYILRDEEINRKQRAQELLDLIQKAGPTAIKVGQALSVRPDLIPSEYAEALSTLQDRVPPFPANEAKALLRQELSAGISKLDMQSMEQPIASASIGQVYKGKYTDSQGTVREVAVKVQRPNGLAEIALDLHIVREFAPTYQKLTRSATDFQSLANEWGRGFIAELAYSEESKNTKKFNEDMKERGLSAVTAPMVVEDVSTDRILVTEWVSGTRLDLSTAGDVPRLCSVALNAYLLMLLETGTLHCDPHPGNLMRTDEGKLCILDWGMTIQTEPGLQYSLLEFVAHLTAEDYDRVPEDLVKLGFLKAERLETVKASGFLEPLTYILKQAGKGGGGDKVRERIFAEYREKYPGLDDDELRFAMRDDMKKQIEEARLKESAVSGITMEVEELQKRNRDAFSIPEWFLYTSRAFLTLEGICLQADENYSIIKSCFPYVARRLLNDDSPRAQLALKELVYGAGNTLDVGRLSDLAGGFSSYTTTQKIVSQGNDTSKTGDSAMSDTKALRIRDNSRLSDTEAAITLAKDGAEIILNPEGNFVQNVIVDESAAAVSAQMKDLLKDALIDTPNRIRNALPLNLGSFLPPPPTKDIEPFLMKSQEEENAQVLLDKIASATGISISSILPDISGEEGQSDNERQPQNSFEDIDPEQLAIISRELRENLPKYGPLLGKLGNKFIVSILERTGDDINRTLEDVENEHSTVADDIKNDPIRNVVLSAARTVSDSASRGAKSIRG